VTLREPEWLRSGRRQWRVDMQQPGWNPGQFLRVDSDSFRSFAVATNSFRYFAIDSFVGAKPFRASTGT